VKRGDIWDVAVDEQGATLRVAVLSGEAWNQGGTAQCVQVVRAHGVRDVLPYIVATAETDPVSGVLDMGWLSPVPTDAGVERIGMLTGATLSKVADSVRKIYEL
jgi:mRNA interferase MazF